jgi:hypothetical protein
MGNEVKEKFNSAGEMLPGPIRSMFNWYNNNEALKKQQWAGSKAQEWAKEGLDYVRTENEPLIKMGDEQLNALKTGVESGAFDMNEDLFSAYQQYVAPQYEPGGMFQYESRDKLMTPEKYQYAQANPEAFRYEQQAPAPFTYSQGGQQVQQRQQAAQQQPQPSGSTLQNGQPMPPQYNPEFEATLSPEQRTEYRKTMEFMATENAKRVAAGQPGSSNPNASNYSGPAQQQAQQPMFNQQQPGQVQYRDFQSQQQAPQFNAVQDFGQQPQQYRATEAPQARYVQPQEQFQSKQFNLQDDPVYQKRLADANKAVEASAAARGMQLSGSNLKALQQNASDLAATEGAAAFDRYRQQDQTDYGRFQDQRADLKDTTRYQTEDEYRRYLDTQNIRGSEADKAVAQWNTDRQFKQGANVENFQTAQGAYSQNRGQDADIHNMNAGNQLAFNAQNLGQYNADRNFAQGVQGQNFDQYATMRGMAAAENAQNFGQFDANRQFDFATSQKNLQNLIDVYNINNANYTSDRAFNYGVDQDYADRQFEYTKENTANKQLESANKYGMLTDSYDRQRANKTNKYGMISDLSNVGLGARNRNADVTMDYYGTIGDIEMQKANAAAAAQQSKSDNGGLLNWLGL